MIGGVNWICNGELWKTVVKHQFFVHNSSEARPRLLILYITHYKKTEPEISLRTNPYPKEITCIQVHPDPLVDKIFFSSGNSIYVINRAYTDKNKIEFNVADDIKTFQII